MDACGFRMNRSLWYPRNLMSDFNEPLTQMAHAQMPFAAQLELQIVDGSESRVLGRASWSADKCTVGGVLHGGYLMSCADAVGGMLAFLSLPEGAIGTTTIESKTNLMGSVSQGDINVEGTVLHAGRTTAVIQTDITDENNRLIARTVQTQLVLRP